MTVEYGKNMMLFTSFWGEDKTFRMMPINQDCPFVEVIYNPAVATLVVIGKLKKEQFQFIPVLDDDGELVRCKKPKTNGKTYREKQTRIELLQEYYILDYTEQKEFIEKFGINSENFIKYLRDIDNEKDEKVKVVEKPNIIHKA